eukprot:CAMPEP_0115239088 /NCGR_PEP_ID=MMETSP0270-20121206/37216_1 /TAXON_ID=71861 /ORGANISM="Scrippsiella trochoidea, Strain CCMP3099" /LENGTH=45 /DNA_ID= /DNA_START= /DNA_END= /DNA_ORIENTATION=
MTSSGFLSPAGGACAPSPGGGGAAPSGAAPPVLAYAAWPTFISSS